MCCAVTTTMAQTHYGVTVSSNFPATLSVGLSNMFRDALGYKDACSKSACLSEREVMRVQEKYIWRHIVQTAS